MDSRVERGPPRCSHGVRDPRLYKVHTITLTMMIAIARTAAITTTTMSTQNVKEITITTENDYIRTKHLLPTCN